MKTEMTARDRKLLIFLVIFVVVVASVYWGIRPIVKSIKTLNISIEEAEAEKDMNKYKISMIPALEVENEQLAQDLENAREGYFAEMSSDEIDKYLTRIMLDHGLYCYDLNFSIATQDSTLEPYKYSAKVMEGMYWDGSMEYSQDMAGSANTGIRCVDATMRVGGTTEQLQSLIDDLSVYDKKLRVESYSWDWERDVRYNSDGTYEIINNRTLTIAIDLYMITDSDE